MNETRSAPGAANVFMTRRLLLRGVGTALVTTPLLPLLSCEGADAVDGTDAGGSADAATGGADGDASTTNDAGTSVAWATGGTGAMKDKASYPNPFAGATLATCALTCEATVGPCYSSQSETIQDISYGHDGLPTRMYLRIVDESCAPVVGATVDVWHVAPAGKYSGNDPTHEQVAFCTGNDADYTSHLYFRGKQTTDANGVVFFDTCFPGWYSGRTVHIHLTVTAVTGSATTQFLFDDALTDDILTTHSLYNTRGTRDTTNQNDNVVAASSVADYLFQSQKMTDGALLLWKTMVLRSVSASSCTVPGGSGGGGMGGPPGVPPA